MAEGSDATVALLWVGTVTGMEAELVRSANIRFEAVRAAGLVGRGLWRGLAGCLQLALGTLQALAIMRRERPQAVLVTGGYAAVPVTLAAWLRRVPVLVYLPDILPGLAVRFVARLANRICVTMDESLRGSGMAAARVTGYPVRPEMLVAREHTPASARVQLHLQPDRTTLLVLGGSQGARSINNALLAAAPELVASGLQILHVTGARNWPELQQARELMSVETKAGYRSVSYLSAEMGIALRAADLVVARAGASCLGEFPLFGLASILVPYPHARGHQQANADAMVARGAAIRLDDENLAAELLPQILALVGDVPRLAALRSNAFKLAQPLAAANLAHALLQLVPGAAPC